jgi:hypothetical protein
LISGSVHIRIFWDVKCIIVDKYFDNSYQVEDFLICTEPDINNILFIEDFDKLILVFMNKVLSLIRIFETYIDKTEKSN